MKTPLQPKSESNTSTSHQRAAGARLSPPKSFEHLHERRKIREQLRRLDWATDAEDAIFA